MTSQAGSNVAKLRGALNGPSAGGQAISDFTLNSSTNNHFISSTTPNGWNAGPGKLVFDCQLTLNGFLAQNPGIHIFISLRQKASLVGTAITGHGVAFGQLSGFTPYSPTPLVESFFQGGNHVYPNSYSAPSKPIADGNTYRLIIESTVCIDGSRYIRYRMYRFIPGTLPVSSDYWDLHQDTGDVLDTTTTADMTAEGIAVGFVFAGSGTTWSVPFTNCKTTWGPAYSVSADQTSRLSIYGGAVAGPIDFSGSSTRIGVVTGASTDYSGYTAVQTTTANLGTGLLIKPNGSATSASVVSVSNSNPSTNYYAASYGVANNLATLLSYGVGTGYAAPEFSVQVGVGNEVMRVKSSAVSMLQGLAFPNNGSTISVFNDISLNYNNWTNVQTSLANGATGLVFKPNGSATGSGVICTNSSTPSGTFGAVSYGINGTKAQIVTYSVAAGISGGTAPSLSLQVGVGNEVAVFSTSGMALLGSTTPVGTAIPLSAGITSFGGTNALALMGPSSGQTLNIDTICSPGFLAGQYGASYSASSLEIMTRPLWAMVSILFADYIKKKLG